jgi:threonine aldolase
MIHLMNDYNMAAHPLILEAIAATADNRYVGYGLDEETAQARETIRQLIGRPEAAVHLMPGGTPTNLTAIGAFLKPYEAAIAPVSAHINMHETGAIEATGHKILVFERGDGKARPEDISQIIAMHTDEHMVKPRLLFLSQTTECGTVYSKAELRQLRAVCDSHGLYLYIDGARLSYALTAEGNDLHLQDIAEIADAFYIGGTKNGLLFGEALVICNPALSADFRYHIKQRGGLLAKGFLLGIQFNTILKDELYLRLAKAANQRAAQLREGLARLGYAFEVDSPTNQIFPIVSATHADRLAESIFFERWHVLPDKRLSIRFVTTWATTEQEICAVLDIMVTSAK